MAGEMNLYDWKRRTRSAIMRQYLHFLSICTAERAAMVSALVAKGSIK
jgi:hypothetical protein